MDLQTWNEFIRIIQVNTGHVYQVRIHYYLSSNYVKDEGQPGPLSKLSVRNYLCIILKPDNSFELEIDRKFPSAWITTNIYMKSTLHMQRG